MTAHTYQIAVLGGGSWGTALANYCATQGLDTLLWHRDTQVVAEINEKQTNQRYLPNITLATNLQATADFTTAVQTAQHLLIATPSHAFSDILARIFQQRLPSTLPGLAWATKGLDPATGQLLHTLVVSHTAEDFPMVLLTGPSFALELAKGLPTAITLATNHLDYGKTWQTLLHSPYFRTYTCGDLTGAELGGAIKNVLAIAVGVAEGMGYGMNAKAGLMTRGLAEMIRIGKALGANPNTLIGLSGLGDLILTCSDNQSRNRRFGLALGQGLSLQAAVESIGQVVEGIPTCHSLHRWVRTKHIQAPIISQMAALLTGATTAEAAVNTLLTRAVGEEC